MRLYENIADELAAAWRNALRRPWVLVGFLVAFGVSAAPLGRLLGGWYQWAVDIGVLLASNMVFMRVLRRRTGLAHLLDSDAATRIVHTMAPDTSLPSGQVSGMQIALKSRRDAGAFSEHLFRYLSSINEVLRIDFVGGPERSNRLASPAEFIEQFERRPERPIVAFCELLGGDELWGIPRGALTMTLVAQGRRAEAVARSAVEAW